MIPKHHKNVVVATGFREGKRSEEGPIIAFTFIDKTNVVAQMFEALPEVPASRLGACWSPCCSTCKPSFWQYAWERSKECLECFGPCIHLGGLEEDPGSRLLPGLVVTVATVLGDELAGGIPASVSSSL